VTVRPPTPERAIVAIRASGCGAADASAVGWIIDGGLVVTVAHAVRGSSSVRVDGGPARVVAIDNRTDVAVLASEGDPATAELSMAARSVRGDVWLARFNGAERLATAARSGSVVTAEIDEPVDATTYTRIAFPIDVSIAPGDSGAPIVDAAGRVTGMAFATARDSSSLTYAVAVDDIRTTLGVLDAASPAVSTGRCG
jgi:S1-C subfamily serine protease